MVLPGQYYDAETNLHYNHYRYYEPTLGRYITSDPVGLLGGFDTYGYVSQNPIGYTDSSGLTAISFFSTAPPAAANLPTNPYASGAAAEVEQFAKDVVGGYVNFQLLQIKFLTGILGSNASTNSGANEDPDDKCKCKYVHHIRRFDLVSPGPSVTEEDPVQFRNIYIKCYYECPDGIKSKEAYLTRFVFDFALAYLSPELYCIKITPEY